MILSVNRAWREFAEDNDARVHDVGEGADYLAVCDRATGEDAKQAQEAASGIRAVLRGEAPKFEIEYPCHSPDRQRWFVGHVTRFSDEGPRRVVVAHENITERKRAEERLQQLSAEVTHLQRVHSVGEMGAALVHELSQPLHAIRNYLNGVRRRLAKGEHPGLIEAITSAMEQAGSEVTRASRIVARLRDFVRRREPHRSTVDVEAMLREALKLMEPEIRRRRARFDFQFDTNLATMLVDPVQVQQVIANLARNALEAMADVPPERRELTITARSVQEELVEFAVRDSGPGLAPDLAGRPFEAFATTKQGGLGMGLAISRSIVEAHGGEIWFTHNEPHGAAFHFTLPRVPKEYSDDL